MRTSLERGQLLIRLLLLIGFQVTLLRVSRSTMMALALPAVHDDHATTRNEPSPRSSLLPLCTMEQVKTGIWKPIRLPKPPFIPTYLQFRNECYTNDELQNAPHWDTHYWEPTDCSFPPWDADEFCALSKNKTIAIIGDSLSLEHFSALAHQLGFFGNIDDVWKKEADGKNYIVSVCDHQTTLLYRRTFFLEPRMLADVLSIITPDIMVLNRGSWFSVDGKLLKSMKRLGPVLQTYQETCRNASLDCQLIWRTTVPGHPDCRQFTEPATSIAAMEAHIANLSLYSRYGRGKFHWWDFSRQNSLVVDLLQEWVSVDNIMPAYDINILRPDQHTMENRSNEIDCLHNCGVSGKVTVYNQLLLQMMKLRKQ